ncbi:MAG TPA: hypothetical protein VFX03_01695, partial [Thermomicrobiales bacterium]|nr:hypothetical protein [Thermomicrobiales bacterium]
MGETTVVLPIREQSAAIVVRAEVADKAGNRTVEEQPLSAARPSAIASGAPLSSPLDESDAPPEMSPTFPHDEPPPADEPTGPYPSTATPDWPAEERASLFNDAAERLPPTGRLPRHDLVSTAASSAVRRLPGLPRDASTGDAALDGPPPGVRPHLVNKPRFALDYDVDAIGSSGVVEVELWITSDSGRTWTSYGLDEDCRSPMVVEMEKEGLYGFRVVVETTAGLRSPSPADGDLPDIWVGVDFTKPEARLISASQGDGEEADRLIICWQADDRHLASRGISLRWSDSPDG